MRTREFHRAQVALVSASTRKPMGRTIMAKRRPRLEVTKESESGRNQRFRDTKTGEEMSRAETVRKIKQGDYKDYHVRKIGGVLTPASNPNRSEKDNLG